MWRPVYVALASIWLLVVLSASVHAQALAPTTLGLASHDQKAADDMVQVITEKSARKSVDKPVKAIIKKQTSVIATKATRRHKEESDQAITKDSPRTFAMEPVRPMNQPTVSTTEHDRKACQSLQLQNSRRQEGISTRSHAILSQADRLPVWQSR